VHSSSESIGSYRHRFAIIEFPVSENPRLDGKTHFAAWPTGKRLLAYLLTELRRAV
jgi:hypothetical protein